MGPSRETAEKQGWRFLEKVAPAALVAFGLTLLGIVFCYISKSLKVATIRVELSE